MPEVPRTHLERETLQRMASVQAALTLTDAEADAVKDTANGLQEFARLVVTRAREGVEPSLAFEPEEWAR